LFVMVFVSLLQTKTVVPKPEEKPAAPAATAKAEDLAPKGKVAVSAVFEFYGTPGNPSTPNGAYEMEGTFDQETRAIQLGGISWKKEVENFGMVPLRGFFDRDLNVFTGNIEYPGCKQFRMNRVGRSGALPISGTWKGVYV